MVNNLCVIIASSVVDVIKVELPDIWKKYINEGRIGICGELWQENSLNWNLFSSEKNLIVLRTNIDLKVIKIIFFFFNHVKSNSN